MSSFTIEQRWEIFQTVLAAMSTNKIATSRDRKTRTPLKSRQTQRVTVCFVVWSSGFIRSFFSKILLETPPAASTTEPYLRKKFDILTRTIFGFNRMVHYVIQLIKTK